MKYLIDHRYKKLNAICIHALSILSTYKRGRSQDFSAYLQALHEELQEIEPIKSTPMTTEQIGLVESIEMAAQKFLLLPENFEEAGFELIEKSQLLMSEIDPFTLTLEDSVGVRKSRLVELSLEIQTYIEAHILHLEGKASSIIDEKLIIQDSVSDIKRIETGELKKEEIEMIDKLIDQNLLYQKESNLSTTHTFSLLALEAERLFRGNNSPYNNLWDLVQYLLKTYNEIAELVSSEEDAFSEFTGPMRAPPMIKAIKTLKDLKLNSKPLMTSRDHLLFAFENALIEEGETFISRCRVVDYAKLFGHELREFTELLAERPDKNLKIS